MKHIFCMTISILCLISITSTAQDFLNKNRPIVFDKKQIDTIKIEKEIDKYFDSNLFIGTRDSIVNKLREEIRKYNINVDSCVYLAIDHRDELIAIKGNLNQLQAEVAIINHVKQLEFRSEQIKIDLRQNLSNFGYRRLFIYVKRKDIKVSTRLPELQKEAKIKITPVAIKAVNGFYINSVTELYKKGKENGEYNDKLFLSIRDSTSGQLRIEKELYKNKNTAQIPGFYTSLLQVIVEPLKENTDTIELKEIKISDLERFDKESENIKIIDVLKERDNYEQKLKDFGVSENEISKIKKEVESNIEYVKRLNETTKGQQKNVIIKGNERFVKVEEDIRMYRDQYNSAVQKIRKHIKEYTNLTFKEEDINLSITNALKQIEASIKSSFVKEREERSKSLFTDFDKEVSAEDQVSKNLAKSVIYTTDQMETNYKTIKQYIQVRKLEREEGVKDTLKIGESDAEIFYRNIDKIWIFPFGGEETNAYVSIVVKFSITDENNNPKIKIPGNPSNVYRVEINEFGEFIDRKQGLTWKLHPSNKIETIEDFHDDQYRLPSPGELESFISQIKTIHAESQGANSIPITITKWYNSHKRTLPVATNAFTKDNENHKQYIGYYIDVNSFSFQVKKDVDESDAVCIIKVKKQK